MSGKADPFVSFVNHARRRKTAQDVVDMIGDLARTDRGAVVASVSNALLMMDADPQLVGLLAYDDFTGQPLITRPPPNTSLPGPYPRPWGTEDAVRVQTYLQRVHGVQGIKRTTVEDAMLASASANRFHPVRDWLATLRWDGVERITTWLQTAFGSPDDEYHRAVGTKFLIAAVRRVRDPGVKFDHMPVLEGAQGLGKSSACRALFGAHWFSDAVPADLTSKDAALALNGVWGLEFAEIEHLIRAEVETIKAFLSRQVDRYRPPYGKAFVERPRQVVLIGTTNSNDYLRDSSGNRRIWPVVCTYADAEWVASNRDQLWAEAQVREASGEAIWLDDSEVRNAAAQQQAARMTEDVWTDPVLSALMNGTPPNVRSILDAMNIPRERQGKREEMRVASILRADGYGRVISWEGGKTVRRWSKDG